MSKSVASYYAAAETFQKKAEKYYAKGCAAAACGDHDNANIYHASAKTCYESARRARESGARLEEK